jgi:hypothetical protein
MAFIGSGYISKANFFEHCDELSLSVTTGRNAQMRYQSKRVTAQAGFPLGRPEFHPSSGHVGFEAEKLLALSDCF